MKIKETGYEIKGQKLVLRSAKEQEAELLLNGLKTVCGETPYLIRGAGEVNMTVEDEVSFINGVNDSEKSVLLLGFLDGEYVGNCSLNKIGFSRQKHRAELGIALFQKYTGIGIGRIMMEKLISVAKELGYEQIELQVVSNNERGIALYKKMGFEICGTYPNAMKYEDGSYADEYLMVRKI